MVKKYSFTKNKKEVNGRILHQIKAERDFSIVKEGELGGWIEKEENLSQDGCAWIGESSCVYDNAHVCGYAYLWDGSYIFDNAFVKNATIINSKISGNAKIYGTLINNASISGESIIHY